MGYRGNKLILYKVNYITTKLGGEGSCVVHPIVVQWISAAVHAGRGVQRVSGYKTIGRNAMRIIP
jgi:hypothetical protein